eukprot:768350-Hanusia_phi.AAC.1
MHRHQQALVWLGTCRALLVLSRLSRKEAPPPAAFRIGFCAGEATSKKFSRKRNCLLLAVGAINGYSHLHELLYLKGKVNLPSADTFVHLLHVPGTRSLEQLSLQDTLGI